MSKTILKNVRLSFPSIFHTEMYGGEDTGKFTATFLLDKEAHADTIKELKKQLVAVAEEKFGKPVPKSIKYCLQDGDEKDYDGYEGCMSLKAGSQRRPTVIDRNKTPLAEEDGKPYAGCYVNASIDFWVQDNSYGKRVNANLNGIQFYADGEAFGSGGTTNAADDFDELEPLTDDGDDPFA